MRRKFQGKLNYEILVIMPKHKGFTRSLELIENTLAFVLRLKLNPCQRMKCQCIFAPYIMYTMTYMRTHQSAPTAVNL
jgi:hypothetical protein